MFLNGELSSHLKNAGQKFSKDEKEKNSLGEVLGTSKRIRTRLSAKVALCA